MKIGRNEPCNCNSGKKFKNCCLKENTNKTTSFLIQPHQEILRKYFSQTYFSLDSERNKFEEEIVCELDKNKDIVNVLIDFLIECEKKIGNITSQYNVYDMLFWSRRLAPNNIFNVAESSVMLYREIQTLSIYKYGCTNEELYIDDIVGVIPINLKNYYTCDSAQLFNKLVSEELPISIVSIISDVIRIEILSFLFLDATQLYRVANKGGEVNLRGSKFTLNISDELNFLINLYDKRLSKSNIFSNVGAYFNSEFNKSDKVIFCPTIQLNVDHAKTFPFIDFANEAYRKFFSQHKKIEAQSNFLLGAINLNEIYNFLNLFSTEFYKEYSYSVEEFVVFLGFIGMGLLSNIYENPLFQLNVLYRAYSLRDHQVEGVVSEFRTDFAFIYETLFDKKISEEVLKDLDLRLVVDTFTQQLSKRNELDLWTRGPKKLFHQLSDTKLIVDYTALNSIVAFIAKNIARIDGESGDIRGGNFEDLIISKIEKTFGKDKIWIKKQVIESKAVKREIDATLIIEDVLFLIEAKAINLSFGFDKGDKKALDFRKMKMQKAIAESNDKAAFIIKNKDHLNIDLPYAIKFICPIVISSFPEYIWGKSEELFISFTNSLPRILTINDIGDLKNINLAKLKSKSWMFKVD